MTHHNAFSEAVCAPCATAGAQNGPRALNASRAGGATSGVSRRRTAQPNQRQKMIEKIRDVK